MLTVINRYKFLLIILSLILLALLIWYFTAGQKSDNNPSRGVYVMAKAAGSEWW